MSARYAVYFAPKKHATWWNFGAHWLGRNDHDLSELPRPQLENISAEELMRFTQEPRRYGFHATLKAPFRLLPAFDESDLVARLGQLAKTLAPVALGPLRLVTLDRFVALVPDTPLTGLQTLAAACVTELDDLRAPLQEEDLARRRRAQLDARQTELLARYGYPYVLERFRFHLTLTGPLESAETQRVTTAAAASVAWLNTEAPLRLDRLCLFVERASGEPFQRIAEVELPS